jgi:methylated-DNA-[protein]-cysteine S-methyltransferase
VHLNSHCSTTAVGRCGIVWGERGVLGFLLPEGREDQTRARLSKRVPDAQQATPPNQVQRAIDDVIALLRGQPRDLSYIVLDMDGVPSFHQRVYAVARTIPPVQR